MFQENLLSSSVKKKGTSADLQYNIVYMKFHVGIANTCIFGESKRSFKVRSSKNTRAAKIQEIMKLQETTGKTPPD